VMALGRNFEEALLKAIRCLEIGQHGLRPKHADQRTEMEIEQGLEHATDERLFLICEAFYRGMSVDEVRQLTYIDPWFLVKIEKLVALDKELRTLKSQLLPEPTPALLAKIRQAKVTGFGDRHIGDLLGISEKESRNIIATLGIQPTYKMVDTCAAEFEAHTPYFYSVGSDAENEAGLVSKID